jgi:hypothetical protein
MATALLRMEDCDTSGRITHRFELRLASERISVRDLIKKRVQAEIERRNQVAKGEFTSPVQPTETEAALNGNKLRQPKMDPDQQYQNAIKAFQSNGFLLFVGDRQITELESQIVVTDDTKVQFLKLIPLIGG